MRFWKGSNKDAMPRQAASQSGGHCSTPGVELPDPPNGGESNATAAPSAKAPIKTFLNLIKTN